MSPPADSAMAFFEDGFFPLTSKQRKKVTKESRRNARRSSNKAVTELRSTRKELSAKTLRQSELMKSIMSNFQTIAIGPAGTGKTYVTAALAAQFFKQGKVEKIIITRPNVGTGRSIGFFPGSLEDKMAPWLAPISSVLKEYLGGPDYQMLMRHGDIEVVPFEVIRDRSFKNAFIMLDEAQNTTIDEMKAFLTRIGDDSVTVVSGDVRQSDLEYDNGLAWACDRIETHKYLRDNVGLVEFKSEGYREVWFMQSLGRGHRTVGIDYSITSPGVCVFDGPGEFNYNDCVFYGFARKKYVGQYGNITLFDYPDYGSNVERYRNLAETLLSAIGGGKECGKISSRCGVSDAYKCDETEEIYFHIEGYSYGSKGRAVFNIAENCSVLKDRIFTRWGILPTDHAPGAVKRFATGSGNANKDVMYDAFVEETGDPIAEHFQHPDKPIGSPTSDIVDAYFVAKLGWFSIHRPEIVHAQ